MRRALSFRKDLVWIATMVALAALVRAAPAQAADPAREFVMSCSYGVLAGTLVGAAALAFTDKPGDNLNLIARGASIGLYAGIALGIYVVDAADQPEEDPNAIPISDMTLAPGGPLARAPRALKRPSLALPEPRSMLVPIIGARGIEGGILQFAVARF